MNRYKQDVYTFLSTYLQNLHVNKYTHKYLINVARYVRVCMEKLESIEKARESFVFQGLKSSDAVLIITAAS